MQEVLGQYAPRNADRSVNFDEFGRVISMTIYEDGFYVSVPFNSNVTIRDIDNDTGELTTTHLDLRVQSQVGYIWADGSHMRFCTMSDFSTTAFRMQAEGPDGSASKNIDLAWTPSGPITDINAYVPDIEFTCAEDSLSMSVILKPPVGVINHYFIRIPRDRLDETLRDLLDTRFATPDLLEPFDE